MLASHWGIILKHSSIKSQLYRFIKDSLIIFIRTEIMPVWQRATWCYNNNLLWRYWNISQVMYNQLLHQTWWYRKTIPKPLNCGAKANRNYLVKSCGKDLLNHQVQILTGYVLIWNASVWWLRFNNPWLVCILFECHDNMENTHAQQCPRKWEFWDRFIITFVICMLCLFSYDLTIFVFKND